jgi:tRNA1Val (adenine37-N6)-methyltransferase
VSTPDDAALGYQCDPLTRRLRIWQRANGHKATSDDVLLAWLGASTRPEARRCLDLGTGKGTVAMLLSQALPEAHLLGVEAFPESFGLAVRNIAENGLGQRFEVRLGDLRDPGVLAGEAPFDLVTGAPPFMPVGSGPQPRDPQRAAGRFELRGGVEAYVEAAAGQLSPTGACVILMDGEGGARAARAFERAGLRVVRRLDVVPRPGRAPTYALLVGQNAPAGEPPVVETLAMRVPVGDAWSDAFAAVRRRLDLPGS